MAEDRDVENGDLNSILDEMGAEKPSPAAEPSGVTASRSRSSAGSKLSEIENLLSEASTSVPSQTEAVPPADAPALEAKVAAPPRPSPKSEREQSQPAASPMRVPRQAVWFAAAFLALNAVGILAIAGVFLMFSQRQRQGAAELISALREAVQTRQQANPDEPADKQAATDAEKAVELFDAAQYEASLPLLQRGAAAFPDRGDLLWKSGVASMQVQQWRTAVDSFRLYSENFPSDKLFYQALANLAACYKQLGFYALARRTLFRLVALSGRLPEEMRHLAPEAHLQIADCYAQEAAQAEKTPSGSSADPAPASRLQGAIDGQSQ